MKKNTRGILTVEASIVLTLFTLFVLFLFSFARVYRAQNAVSHAVLQAADAIALESNLRESTLSIDESEILDISEGLTGSSAVTPDNFKSLRGANLSEIAKQKFSAAISGSEGDTDKILKKLGIKDGLSGIDFSSSVIDYTNNDIIIYANYVIEMQFPIMGMNEINATKASKAKAFSDILFEIITVPDNALHGSTAGNGSYNYGDEIEITATPAFGYIFMGWDTDGDSVSDTSADLVQTITVDSTKKYTGIFYTDDYRVELSVKSGKGSVETVHEGITSIGGGAYEGYSSLTVNAIPDIGYEFSGWEGYWFKDLNGDNIYNLGEFREDLADIEDATFAIDYITGHYCLSAVFEKKEINIITMVEGIENTSFIYGIYSDNTYVTEKSFDYGSSFKLYAPDEVGNYWLKGWKIKDGVIGSVNPDNMIADVHTENTDNESWTYVAVYEKKCNVSFYDLNGDLYKEIWVKSGYTIGDLPAAPKDTDNKAFLCWKDINTFDIISTDLKIYCEWKNIK